MSDETTKSPNGESGRKKAEVKYVNEKLIDKYLQEHGIDLDAMIAEFTDKEVVKNEESDGANNSANNSTAGNHTKVVNTGVFKLNYLIKNGYLEIAAKEQTPKIKKARVSKRNEKEEPDEIDGSEEVEKS